MQMRNWMKGIAAGLVLAAGGTAYAGPDVIVGELYDPQNYGSAGTAPNEIFAYAIGTYSCNLAPASPGIFKTWLPGYSNVQDNALMWVDSNDPVAGKTHPVISQNLYKLSNGRFTQLGQAWLKHGFCALQGNICGTCTSGGNCDYLYPGCSDPYGGGLNGSQSGLGPKSEINAATGNFPYPWINDGSGAGATFKRLQAKKSELTDSNATFYVSSLYMQIEDRGGAGGYGVAASYNSQSYRRVTINQTSYTMALADTTQREKPGIQAWKDADNTVALTNVDIPSDGRFIVGVKVLTLGGGLYRYEYAIQNFHSEKGAGSFSVPVPAAATVTNIGFHDVDYHSGEPYNNLDWAGVFSGGNVSWTCPTPYNAGNDVGNALRWDTIYNFWFETNQAPQAGTATLGLYKGGGAAAVATTVPGTGGSLPNDNCANALFIGGGTTSFNTASATTDGPAECVTQNDMGVIGKDVWFVWTNGNCSGDATITTCGSSFDTKLAIYNNTGCPVAANTNIACNDDNNACAANSLQSSVTFAAAANTSYLVRVGGYDGDGTGAGVAASGAGQLTVTPPAGCVANDTCGSAVNVASGTTSFDSAGALTEGFAECASTGGYTNIGKDVWFRWTNGATTGTATIDTCGSAFDTKIALYTDSCPGGAGLAIACNDNGSCGTGSSISFSASANASYLIRVGGSTAALGGAGFLNITAPVPVAPANNPCSGAFTMGDGISYAGSTALATDDGSASCGNANNSADVWYKYTPATTGIVDVNTCGSSFDTVVSVFTGSCGALTQIACNDDDAPGGGGNGVCAETLSSGINVPMTANVTYYIRVAGYNGNTGDYLVEVNGGGGCAAPSNDNCSERQGFAATLPFTTCGATTDGVAVTCNGSFQVFNEVWFNYAAQGTGTVTLSTCGASFDSRMAVYFSGTCAGINQANLVGCSDNDCGDDASMTFPVTEGNSYAVRIGGANANARGTGTLNVTFTPAPSCLADLDNDGDFTNGLNPDGGVDINDLLCFLAAFEAGNDAADVADANGQANPDGGVDINDLLLFLARFEAGC